MEILEPYIPKEYLALKINYCRQQLACLPKVTKTNRNIHGVLREVCILNSHAHTVESKEGKALLDICRQRERYICDISKLEGLWNCYFKGTPPSDIEPRRIIRYLYSSFDERVMLDGNYFDSLKNDADPNHRENKVFYYNGIYYRSAAEADIARFYTENRIPFKYEPEIWLKGLNYPIHTDFVILIKELDLCKFHEHFGMKNSVNYNRLTATKYNNYSCAGLIPELDIFYTYDTNDVPFDIRSLYTKLNSVIYNSLLIP
jgi:hypothetical protein